MLVRALLLLEPQELRSRIERLLETADVLVSTSTPSDDFWETVARGNGDLVVVARRILPEPIVQSVADIRDHPDHPDVVILWDREDPKERSDLLVAGCLAVLDETLPDEALHDSLVTLIRKRSQSQNARLDQPPRTESRLSDFVSASPVMTAFVDMASRVVPTDSSLLILGETGVGKEYLARAIHNEGQRRSGPFIAVNCGALPESLLESELFGHERGAFTGATRSRRGYFELGHRGTLFLDEIAEIPHHLQVRLLRVLQDYEIRRVGSERVIEVDVRVVAATNRDLIEEVAEKRFRQDLYYRLGVVTLTVPPLRERREDIPDLVERYLDRFRVRMVRNVTQVSEEAMVAMLQYSWPGNIRELVNVIERAVLLCRGETITLEDLPQALVLESAASRVETSDSTDPQSLIVPERWMDQSWTEARRQALAAFERAYLIRLLQSTQGRIGDAARKAGIQPRSLFEKMRSHGIRKEHFKSNDEE